jgi:hypothetical protein
MEEAGHRVEGGGRTWGRKGVSLSSVSLCFLAAMGGMLFLCHALLS